MDYAKHLQETLKMSQKAIKELDRQKEGLDKFLISAIGDLEGDDKQKIKSLQARINLVMNKAKNGGDYLAEIEKIKEQFKNEINNGSNSRTEGV